MSDSDFPLPPASFEFLVMNLRMQAEMQLGLIHFGPEDEKPEPDLRISQHTIDLMAMLLEKTKGNLETTEKRLLENSLTELRYRWVQVKESQAAKPAV
jgi:hypothetical protein